MKVGGGGVVSGGAVKGTGGGHLLLHLIPDSDHCSEAFIICSGSLSTGYILTYTPNFGNNLN